MDSTVVYSFIESAQQKYGVGQRLNLIIEDIMSIYTYGFKEYRFSQERLWSFLFDPVLSAERHLREYDDVYSTLKLPNYQRFFVFVKEALQDPPAPWWKEQYKEFIECLQHT